MSGWHNHLKPQSDQVERHGMAQPWGHRNSSSICQVPLFLDTQPRHSRPLLAKWLRKAHGPAPGTAGRLPHASLHFNDQDPFMERLMTGGVGYEWWWGGEGRETRETGREEEGRHHGRGAKEQHSLASVTVAGTLATAPAGIRATHWYRPTVRLLRAVMTSVPRVMRTPRASSEPFSSLPFRRQVVLNPGGSTMQPRITVPPSFWTVEGGCTVT